MAAIDPSYWTVSDRWQVWHKYNNFSLWHFSIVKAGRSLGIGMPPTPVDDSFAMNVKDTANTTWRGSVATASAGWILVSATVNAVSPPETTVDGVSTVVATSGPNRTRTLLDGGPLHLGGGIWGWLGRMTLVSFHEAALTEVRLAEYAAATDLADYTSLVMADSPSAFWRHQESSGVLADYTGNGHDATPFGSLEYGLPGPFADAVSVGHPGTPSDYFEVADDPVWQAPTFTMVGWLWVGVPPVAVIEAVLTSGTTPLVVSFDGSDSTADGGIDTYTWDFGDGTLPVSGVSPSHTFTTPGVYTVTLTVTDFGGGAAQATTTVVVVAACVDAVTGVPVPGPVAILDPDGNEAILQAFGTITDMFEPRGSGFVASGADYPVGNPPWEAG